MTEILAADIRALDSLPPRRLAALEKKLSPARLEKMRRYLLRDDRLRCLAAGLLLADVLDERAVSYGEHGKPFVPGGPHFNLSHSGDLVLLAWDDAPLGLDVERWQEEDYEALARVSFHPEERAWLSSDPSAKNFFDLWTLKESYIKMRGTGFSMDPTTFRLVVEGRSARLVEPSPVKKNFFRLYGAFDGYSVALCTTVPDMPDRITSTSPFFS